MTYPGITAYELLAPEPLAAFIPDAVVMAELVQYREAHPPQPVPEAWMNPAWRETLMDTNTVIWLCDPWSQIAHSTHGRITEDEWRTKCGIRILYRGFNSQKIEPGSCVRWINLNHDRVLLCKKCWPKGNG